MDKSRRESASNVLIVTIAVCMVCSIVVSATAVTMQPMQQRNAELDRQLNVLRAAGLLPPRERTDEQGRGIEELFREFDIRAVDLRAGEFTDAVDPETYDQLRAARDPQMSRPGGDAAQRAGVRRLENYALVYVIEGEEGIETLVLPIRGGGLWGTMYGFLALREDLETIAGLTFFDHQETPGLGGEVDNPRWKAQWEGVELFDEELEPAVRLVKTRSPPDTPQADHEVDALAGATLTTRGVERMIHFWMGDDGFGPFLQRLKAEEA